MDALENIFTRKSVRSYLGKPIPRENQRRLFDLPEHMIPHSIIALGYEDPDAKPEPRRGPSPKEGEKPAGLPPERRKLTWSDFVHYESF